MSWTSIVPITAVFAIAIFVMKEIIEFLRRRSSDRRRLLGLTALLARECELNYWTIKALRRVISEISTDENPNPQIYVTIERKPNGRPYARIVSEDGGLETHTGIPEVHRELMSKFILDVATLDKALFEVLEPAYDALADVEHVRESLLQMDDDTGLIPREDYRAGFSRYALEKLDDAESLLSKLYVHCTGKPLTKHRLR